MKADVRLGSETEKVKNPVIRRSGSVDETCRALNSPNFECERLDFGRKVFLSSLKPAESGKNPGARCAGWKGG